MPLVNPKEERAVIDDALILASKEDEGEEVNMMRLMVEMQTLKLSYKNIFKIANLNGFTNMTKLCLDNNVIEEIVNLDHLVNLTWLDLSFNNITEIKGLDTLTKLTDLSLYNNQITKVEGIDNLVNLECFSIGNNHLTVDQLHPLVLKLRNLRQLKLLNLEGNPMCDEGDYRMTVLAYLDGLKYLDYGMVHQPDVLAAKDQFQDELLDIEEKEALRHEVEQRNEAAREVSATLSAANLSVVETVFNSMFQDDTDHQKIKHLPGHAAIFEKFQSGVANLCDDYKVKGLEQHESRQTEFDLFTQAVAEIRTANSTRATSMVEDFLNYKKGIVRDLEARDEVKERDVVGSLRKLEDLVQELMDLEIRHVDLFDQLFTEFESKFDLVASARSELQREFFDSAKDLEDTYTKQVVSLATELLEKAANDDMDDLREEAQTLLIDRDTCMTAVTSSHDNHVSKLFKGMDNAESAEQSYIKKIKEGVAEEELERNRGRVMEIHTFKRATSEQLRALIHERRTNEDDEDGGYL